MLEKEEERFPMLVDLFSNYYMQKQTYENKIIKVLDDMTVKAHELTEFILQKVNEKRKSRGTFSTIKTEEILQF